MDHEAHIRLLRECADHCRKTLFDYCIEKGGEHSDRRHVEEMIDCIEACKLAADFMVRGSEQHPLACGLCANICTTCAESCEALDDPVMKECAGICRRCAKACEEMAGSAKRKAA
jgi:hypothetical protein